jgi:hypothetical protein
MVCETDLLWIFVSPLDSTFLKIEISTYIVALVLTLTFSSDSYVLDRKKLWVLIIYLIFMSQIEAVLVTLLFDHGQLRPIIVCQP